MSRILITICISLLLVSTTYAGVIGNWESGTDGWGAWVSSAVAPATNSLCSRPMVLRWAAAPLKSSKPDGARHLPLTLPMHKESILHTTTRFRSTFRSHLVHRADA